MKTVQRERRYVCGQTKQNAVYQEIEIYTVGTDQKSRQREKQKVTPVPFRGKNPEHWDGHNAKRARKWFIRLLNTNFTEADTHTSLTLQACAQPYELYMGAGQSPKRQCERCH